jgi:hypothetical protein
MFLNLLGLSAPGPLDFVIDQNPNKSDRYIAISGQVIRSPAHLVEAPVEEVVVMNSIYRDEIQRQLAGLNVHARVLIA